MNSHPPHFAGIPKKSEFRIRKPPGGDTNDIFGLEKRQKIQADQTSLNRDKLNRPTEMAYADNVFFDALQDIDVPYHGDDPDEIDPARLDSAFPEKENIFYEPPGKAPLDEPEPKAKCPEYLKPAKGPNKTLFQHNPITGLVTEVEVANTGGTRGYSNSVDQDRLKAMRDSGAKTNSHIQQPPGGRSSLMF